MKIQDLSNKQKKLLRMLPTLEDAQISQMMGVIAPSKACPVQENSAFQELMSMIGCEEAKDTIREMIGAHRMYDLATRRGRKVSAPYFHAVFTGNPGCAKTTVARLLAKILAKEGITTSECFAEISRASLCGRYQGETAQKVKAVLQENRGGVIFVDEAYSLVEHNPQGGYGEEAINELIISLENDPATVMIFAGYPDQMEEFLHANPGLRSRIPYHIHFQDYTPEELLGISKVLAETRGYDIDESMDEPLRNYFRVERKAKDFANGRFCRNLVESAIRRKAIHLKLVEAQDLTQFLDSEEYSNEVLFLLDETCFDLKRHVESTHQMQKIGF